MKILDIITEGKFTKQVYAYHATQGRNLRSILKHGLIPNKSEGGWGSEDTASAGYQLSALSGVYFSPSPTGVVRIAELLDPAELPPIIVIAKVQNRTADLDEDHLTIKVLEENRFASRYARSSSNLRDEDPEEVWEAHREKEIAGHVNYIMSLGRFEKLDDRLHKNVTHLITKYFRELALFIEETNTGNFDEDITEIKNLQNTLTKKLKNLLPKNANATFKIDEPISFSGANKIVGIFCPETDKGWGDVGGFGRNHRLQKVDHPSKLFTKAELVPNSD